MSRLLSGADKDFILVKEVESIGEKTSPLAISIYRGNSSVLKNLHFIRSLCLHKILFLLLIPGIYF